MIMVPMLLFQGLNTKFLFLNKFFFFLSCKDEKKEGNFTLNIYFDCDPKFISLEKIGDKNVVFEEIEEEEEDYQDAPKELKELLKIRYK